MIDELKGKVTELEQELKSWSVDFYADLEELRDNMLEVEKHLRQQQALLQQKRKENADLTAENGELKGMLNGLLETSSELLRTGPQTWISDLKKRCSGLIDAAAEVESAADGSAPEAAGAAPVVSAPYPLSERETDESRDDVRAEPVSQAPTPPPEAPVTLSEAPTKLGDAGAETDTRRDDQDAKPKKASGDVDSDEVDSLMSRVERLMQVRSH